MPLLYDLGIGLYHTVIRAAANFNPKAGAWVEGRKGLWERLEERRDQLQDCLWMHCASVGEFEQGRPVLEALAVEHPDRPVLLTFFSPSGYEARKDYRLPRPQGSAALHVDYLPPDSPKNARRMVALLNPSMVLWVKYEFWYHHLLALRSANIPVYLVSGIFRKGQPFFHWYGKAWRRMLGCFTHLFVQDGSSRELLANIGHGNVTVSGDTRFDRVATIAATRTELPIARAFRGTGPVLVCGSTWPADEDLLLSAFERLGRYPKCIVAAHELEPAKLARIEERFPRPLVRWSELEGTTAENIEAVLGVEAQGTLLVDRMGLLAKLYRYGDIAYVGGGFGDGIHSLLEAAAWGCPVIFGPRHHKFPEAQGLINAGAGFEVHSVDDLCQVLQKLSETEILGKASHASADHVGQNKGATERVVSSIEAMTGVPVR